MSAIRKLRRRKKSACQVREWVGHDAAPAKGPSMLRRAWMSPMGSKSPLAAQPVDRLLWAGFVIAPVQAPKNDAALRPGVKSPSLTFGW